MPQQGRQSHAAVGVFEEAHLGRRTEMLRVLLAFICVVFAIQYPINCTPMIAASEIATIFETEIVTPAISYTSIFDITNTITLTNAESFQVQHTQVSTELIYVTTTTLAHPQVVCVEPGIFTNIYDANDVHEICLRGTVQ